VEQPIHHHTQTPHPILLAGDRKPRVLVVDDVADNVQFLSMRLKTKGFEVSTASNGVLALEHVAQMLAHNTLPDVILLDVQMPEMDGFEACKRLKADPQLAAIPVIFLTSRSELEDVMEGFELGAVDYIAKPFHPNELLTRIRTHIELKLSQDLLRDNNRELSQLNERLQQLNQEKNEFLGMAAHDLRNPLSGIRLLAELLEGESNLPPAKTSEALQGILTNVERMSRILQNLLDVNAIEEGKLAQHLEQAPVNLLLIAADTVSIYAEAAAAKNITLEVAPEISFDEAELFSSGDILLQVASNLVSNALKYSPPHTTVRVSVSAQPAQDSAVAPAQLLLAVRDEGPGLNDDDMKKVFGKFARLSAQPTGDEQSTGLGLFIVKKLMTMLGGDVACRNNVDNHLTTDSAKTNSAKTNSARNENLDNTAQASRGATFSISLPQLSPH
jgi:two-component system, sensor histidine kinase and response regulator